jgi:PKD repeat protein
LPKVIIAQFCDTKFDYHKLGKEAQFRITSKLNGEVFFLKYIWDFGDGTTPITSNVNYIDKIFINPGKYKVCVKDDLCSDSTKTYCDSIEVLNDTPIVADFSYRQDVEGEITLFNKSTSSFPIKNYHWLFYNEDIVNGENDSVVHYLKSIGNVNICIYVFDEQNNYNYKCSSIFIPQMFLCYPDFKNRIINGTHNFYNFSEFPTFSAQYLWDFGDGTTSTEREPKYDFIKGGTYNVSLTINGPCNRKVTKKLTVFDKPICHLKVAATVVNKKATITIADTANLPTSYSVDFGDGNYMIAEDKTIEHIYADYGTYTITIFGNHTLCGEIYGIQDVNIKPTIPQLGESFNFHLYPSPSTGLVNMEWNNFTLSSIEILNMVGAKQNINYEIDSNKALIDLNTLKDGLYFVKATNLNGEVVMKKLVKSIQL